ncbi:hypothetical protein CGCFRS4_v011628 [Colletotrichum fructicola]|nr:hypothetical protein CGCFRS4_v011628 [Colletotrichum fructicola]
MQLPHGNGRHRMYLSDYDYKMINMYGWYGQLFHFTSMACLKCSICALVLRLNDKKGLQIFIYTIIAGVLSTLNVNHIHISENNVEVMQFVLEKLRANTFPTYEIHLRSHRNLIPVSRLDDCYAVFGLGVTVKKGKVGQLWMRITRGNTIVTSFPKGYGRDLADPSSIYMSIRRKLADRATHIAIEPYDIALVVIDECIGTFFQRPESPAAELKVVPHGISALTQDVATIADKTCILREAHRTLLPSRSAVASSDILLQLLNLRLDIEELIQDLSMVAQVLAEQSTCVDDFIKMGALVAKGIQHDRLLSPDWIEPQLIKSRINSHKYEVKSLADTASGVHRTIVSLLQHVHLKTLLKEGTDFTRK